MTTYRYPQNDFDRAETLFDVLGSFWTTVYQGNSLLQNLSEIKGQVAQQTNDQFLELVNSISRKNVPLYHRENWYALAFSQTELNQQSAQIEKYDYPASHIYSSPEQISYGVAPSQVKNYAVKKPENLAEVKAIFNKIVAPSVSLVLGVDYWVTDTQIVFREDPFKNSKIPKKEVFNGVGEIVDREITLWLYQGLWDWEYIYSQFGYVLKLQLSSSEGYKEFINAIFDALNFGTAVRSQQLALSAAFGIPITMEAEETVKVIRKDKYNLNIITDQHVYQFPVTATPIVTENQVVSAGSMLTDSLEIFELNRGNTPNIPAFSVGPDILAWGFFGDLTFPNKEVPVQVTGDVTGQAKVSWEIQGFPYDIDKFWEDVHLAGLAKGQTLAQLLSGKTDPIDEAEAKVVLPKTINPFDFLVKNLLRNNATIVKIKFGKQLKNKLKFVPVEQLRKIQNPQSLLIFLIELEYQDNLVIMEGPGSATSPGYSETVSKFECMETSDTINPNNFIQEKVRSRLIGGRCL